MESREVREGKILAVSQPKEYMGILSIGFKIQETWYNARGTMESLEELLKTIVIKGYEIQFEWEPIRKEASNFKVLKVAEKSPENSARSDWKDDMTNYEDLLNAAHAKAKKDDVILNMESRPVKDAAGNPLVNFKDHTALYQAVLTLTHKQSGQIMQRIVDTGDAEGITNSLIQPHFNRMASTRAMARCYRIYTNNAQVAAEETSEM